MTREWNIGLVMALILLIGACTGSGVNLDDLEETVAAEALILTSPPAGTLGELLAADRETAALIDGVADVGDVPSRVRLNDGTAYVVNSLSGTVVGYSAVGLTKTTETQLSAGANPMDVAFAGGNGWVTQLLSNSVAKFSLGTGSVEGATVPTGVQPTGITAIGDRLVVANTGFVNYDPDTFVSTFTNATLTIIDASTAKAVTDVSIDCVNPQWVEAHAGALYVLCSGDFGGVTGKLLKLDGSTYAETTSVTFAGFPGTLAVGPDRVAVGGFGVGLAVYDPQTLSPVRTFTDGVLAGEDASQFAFGTDGELWVAQWTQMRVRILDSTYATAASIDIGANVQDVLLVP